MKPLLPAAALAVAGLLSFTPSAGVLAQGTTAKPAKPAERPAQRAPQRRDPNATAVRRVAPPAPVEPELPLTDAELAVAALVHVGALNCELGNNVRLERDAQSPGYFKLSMQKLEFRMRPVVSRTGAVRLEDRAQGAVWLQLANKSMLMSQTQGRRLADECAGEEQRAVAEAHKLNPPPNLLDPAPAPK